MTSLKNVFGAGLLCAGLVTGCGGADRDDSRDPDKNEVDIAASAPIVETGCLTASGDRFVLTALETTDDTGVPQTELYQLIGESAELRPHVGKAVRVTGEAEPASIADVRETSQAAPAGTAGSANTRSQEARVQTESQTRIETSQLRVQSVTPTGDDCVAQGR
jgi:hypothetical protein